MFELKPLTPGAVPAALAKAERYRLLNEPAEAESICLDVLQVDPGNQAALVLLLLALTDQFDRSLGSAAARAQELLPRLRDEYERAYYAGIICERRAKAQLLLHTPGSGFAAYEGFRAAMDWYDRADAKRPPDNDDARLRWNACARILMRHDHLKSEPEPRGEPLLLE